MTRTDWRKDKADSDRFIPHMKEILGGFLIHTAPFEEDALRNSDLVVFKMDSVRIACRYRRHKWFGLYPNQITIRSRRPARANGEEKETELSKIVSGWGDFMLYGFAHDEPSSGRLCAWRIIDLTAFRGWFTRQLYRLPAGVSPGIQRSNTDKSSDFTAFDVSMFPPGVVALSVGFASPVQQEMGLEPTKAA